MPCQNTTTNPAQITVPSNTDLDIYCKSFAMYYQQVILSFNPDMSNPFTTFSGTGEGGVLMAGSPQGTALVVQNTGNNTAVYAQFNFSPSGSSGPFQPAGAVCMPEKNLSRTRVTSEDASDSDNNDSILTINA